MAHSVKIEVSEPLPKDQLVSESVIVLKCVDAEGISTLAIRTSDGLAVWDAVGMLQVGADAARRDAQDQLSPFHED